MEDCTQRPQKVNLGLESLNGGLTERTINGGRFFFFPKNQTRLLRIQTVSNAKPIKVLFPLQEKPKVFLFLLAKVACLHFYANCLQKRSLLSITISIEGGTCRQARVSPPISIVTTELCSITLGI